ncbi:hypothetical protein X975_23418, partial [Stegodyphus mimosarum]
MMNIFWVFVTASALALGSCDNALKDPDLEAVQKKLEKLDFIEKMIALILASSKKTEQREDCIEYGGECALVGGPNCCGFSNWCNYHDEHIPG